MGVAVCSRVLPLAIVVVTVAMGCRGHPGLADSRVPPVDAGVGDHATLAEAGDGRTEAMPVPDLGPLDHEVPDLVAADAAPDPSWVVLGQGNTVWAWDIFVDAQGHSLTHTVLQGPTTFALPGPLGTQVVAGSGRSALRLDAKGSLLSAHIVSPSVSGSYGMVLAPGTGGGVQTFGDYNGSVTYGATTLASAGGWDIFSASLDGQGALLWAGSFGGAGDERVGGVIVDDAGNSFITGSFSGKVALGTTILQSQPNAAGDSKDLFVAKLDPTGTAVWAVSGGGAGEDVGLKIALDGSGGLRVAGTFQSCMSLGTSSVCTQAQKWAAFVARLDATGKPIWTAVVNPDIEAYAEIAVDSAGRTVLAGTSHGDAELGGITLKQPSVANPSHGYVARLDASGKFEWATSVEHITPHAVAVDQADAVYVTGALYKTATLGSTVLTANGVTDIFVARLTGNGSFSTAVAAGGAYLDSGEGIGLDQAKNTYVSGVVHVGASDVSDPTTFGKKIFLLTQPNLFVWMIPAGTL